MANETSEIVNACLEVIASRSAKTDAPEAVTMHVLDALAFAVIAAIAHRSGKDAAPILNMHYSHVRQMLEQSRADIAGRTVQ